MGEHSAEEPAKVAKALAWVAAHRRKIYGVIVVALPLVARYVPGFPADAVLKIVQAFLGS
ncbi:hypothetical protein [Streptomyces sp. NPDC055006]